MGTPRSSTVPSSQSSVGKKQKSISGFFTAKPAAPVKPKPAQQVEPSEPSTQTDGHSQLEAENDDYRNGLFVSEDEAAPHGKWQPLQGAKRSLDNAAELNGDTELPDLKRLRYNVEEKEKSATALGESLGEEPQTYRTNSLPAARKPKVTERTSKYMFSSSQVLVPPQEEEMIVDDEEMRKVKERLHQKFKKKLGRPDSIAEIKRRNRHITEEIAEGQEGGDEDDEADEEPEPQPKARGRKGATASKSKDKLTPLEKQVLAIKHKHPDTLLVVEVGYKFKFFGEDARAAAKELSIVCIPGKYRFDEHPSEAHINRFASASVPVHRLHVHVKRLVSAGHKVGVVRQLETAALKAVGDNRNKTFERGLTNLYTKGTYIDDQESLEPSLSESGGNAIATGHLLCLTETSPKGWGTDEKVQIGLVAVQPQTGDIIYDDFEDGWMRSELETRLLHIAPCEFLIVGEVSRATDKLVKHLSASKTNIFGDNARVERIEKPKTMAAQSYSHITKFYADKMSTAGTSSSQVEFSQENGTLLDKVHKLSENATICLSAMIEHLREYGLEHVFDLTKYFQSFSSRSHMLLNGNTLNSLEIYLNQTDYSERGSLFWTLDRTQTRFGQRLLRKWVGRPLLDRTRLDERVAAVEELKNGEGTTVVERIKKLLGKTRGDLEKSLIRIYYKKCSRPELLSVLQTLQMIAQEFAHVSSPADSGFQSSLISEAVAALPRISDYVVEFLERISLQDAKDNDKYNFFRESSETTDIKDHKVGILAVEQDLNDFKVVAAEKLGRKKVDYVTVAGIEFLIELDNTQLKKVPASWAKISGTKKNSRYHAPEVVTLIRERDQHKEALANACDAAFADLLGELGSKYQAFRDCVQSLATLDCLLSLAEIATQPGYCRPEFTNDIGIAITAGRHPMVEQLLLDAFVPNDIHLSSATTRALLITGPNMGGKSSYVRSVALIAIMAQVGSYVPADAVRLGLLDAVFTRMGAFDNMLKGESTFMVELSETSDILKQATPRSLVILDELGRGTSTHDGVAIAQAVLNHMVSDLKSLTLFITHYQSLARLAMQFAASELQNVHMRFNERNNDDGSGGDVTFLYEVGEGVAHRSYGLNVARLAGLPKSLIVRAAEESAKMELEEGKRRLNFLAGVMQGVIGGGEVEKMEVLVKGIEQL
jgi:DNA mismatch repair protein MSH3